MEKTLNSSNHSGLFSRSPYTSVEIVLIVLVAGSLSLITVVGNILVMVSIKVNRNLQTVNNYFLFSLACADLIIGICAMNLYTIYIVIGYWPLGEVVCDLWLAVDYVVSSASVMNLLIISFDRYFCVTKPLSYPARRSTKMAGLMIAAAWVLSFILWAPPTLFWQFIVGGRTVPPDKCKAQFLPNQAVTFGTAIATFYLPVVVMIYLYWCIYKASRSRVKRESRKTSGTSLREGWRLEAGDRKDKEMLQQQKGGPCIEENTEQMDSESIHASTSKDEPAASRANGGKKTNQPQPPSGLVTRLPFKVTKRRRKGVSSREKKVTHTIMTILVAFVITWTPYNVMVLIKPFCSVCIPNTLWTIGYWLSYINSTINPACYALCNVTFKNTFKHLLLCRYKNVRTAQ